ncbi:phosphatase PAP2 family protein [Echinicola marina]|nr:phosphatase PAP2 family protein [Echinicola marina]
MKKKSIPYTYIFYYFFIVFLIGAIFLSRPKGAVELLINQHHFLWADIFFSTVTHLGDGLVFLAVFPVLLMYRYSFALLCSLNAAIHMLIALLMKKLIFPHAPRPLEYFKDVDLVQVAGVTMHHWHSFPSGHTATAFALTSMVSMVFPKRHFFQVLMLLIAVLVGFSRVYLMQHFMGDVLVGSFLGLSSALLSRCLVVRYFNSKVFKSGLLPKRKIELSKLATLSAKR